MWLLAVVQSVQSFQCTSLIKRAVNSAFVVLLPLTSAFISPTKQQNARSVTQTADFFLSRPNSINTVQDYHKETIRLPPMMLVCGSSSHPLSFPVFRIRFCFLKFWRTKTSRNTFPGLIGPINKHFQNSQTCSDSTDLDHKWQLTEMH